MYDTRIVMRLVHQYGQACVEQRWDRAGVLYGWIVRCLDEVETDEERPPGPETERALFEVRQ